MLLPTFNCEQLVRDTLESVRWANEILVVDSYSTDGTLTICQEYGARILKHDYVNSASQKNWGLRHCRYEWVLQIDSDETLEPGLREEIQDAIATATPDVHLFLIPRKNHMLGRWIRYGGNFPDYQTRLFRREQGEWSDREVHAHVVVPGEVHTLSHAILHNNMPYIGKELRNFDRYTRYEADELRKQAKPFRWHDLLIRPWLVFCHHYFWLQGFRDGWRGLIYSVFTAMYIFTARAKLWEIEELKLKQSPR